MSKCEHCRAMEFKSPCGKPATVRIRRKQHATKARWRYFCDDCATLMLNKIHEPVQRQRLTNHQ